MAKTKPFVMATTFADAEDINPKLVALPWEDLAALLLLEHKPRALHRGDDPKKGLPAVCGASFKEGATRSAQGVDRVHLLCLDIDNSVEIPVEPHRAHLDRNGNPTRRLVTQKVRVGNPVDPEAIQVVLRQAGVASVSWTTYSSKPDWPKSRVIIPLARPIPPATWPQAVEWGLNHLGLDPFRHGMDLAATRRAAGLFFLPGAPDPTQIRRWTTQGAFLDIPEEELGQVHLPEPARPAWVLPRAKADASRPWWKAYDVDFKTLDLAAFMQSMGVKVGPGRACAGGTKFRCHCPWASEHSHGLDDDGAFIVHRFGKWPIFRCSHSCHQDLELRDVVELFGGVR